MLPGLGYVGPGFGVRGGAEPFSLTDLGTLEDSGVTTNTFSFGDFGDETAGRLLIALFSARDAATLFTLNTVTIGGVSAAIHVDTAGATSVCSSAIASAVVPTGASGDVVATYSEGRGSDTLCTLLRATGTNSAPHDTASAENLAASGTTPVSTTIDVEDDGFIVAVASWISGADQGAWTGLSTETHDAGSSLDNNVNHLSGYQVYPTGATGVTITATPATAVTERTLAVVSFSLA